MSESSLSKYTGNFTPRGVGAKVLGFNKDIDLSQFEAGERPESISYQSILNRPVGSLEQRLRQQATSTAPSEYTGIRQSEIQKSLQQQLGQQAAIGQSGAAQQQAQLAMRGGLGSGARERLASGTNLQQMLSQQQLRSGAESARQQALAEDYANKENLQKSFAQSDMQAALQDAQMRNQFNLGMYQSQMGEWAAAKAAQQQAALANRPDMLSRLTLGTI